MKNFYIFLRNNLHMSKKSSTFASELKKSDYIIAIRYNSQITFIYKQQKLCHYEKSLFSTRIP